MSERPRCCATCRGWYGDAEPCTCPESSRPAQRQDSLLDQLGDVMREAVEMGCYDAAEWIRVRAF